MIGSLVLVYPTKHEGGSLVLRHGDEEWTFDSGKALLGLQQPSIAYVAFFSDVEHEVTPVQVGYRVTLTYNLYVRDSAVIPSKPLSGHVILDQRASAFKTALRSLLDDTSFYPDGGLLGFGLFHEYPVKTENVGALSPAYLKGRDATIYAACKDLGLRVRTTFLYEYSRTRMLCDDLDPSNRNYEDGELLEKHMSSDGQVLFRDNDDEDDNGDDCEYPAPPLIAWITEPEKLNLVEKPFIVYGNQASLDHCYGQGCLVAEIGKPGQR